MPSTVLGTENTEVAMFVNRRDIFSSIPGGKVFSITPTLYIYTARPCEMR